MSRDKLSDAGIERLPEFREGAKEFMEDVSDCPACALKLALELVESDNPEDRQLLKNLLIKLGKKIIKHEESHKSSLYERGYFPLIEAWLKGEIGLGIIAKLFGVKSDDKM